MEKFYDERDITFSRVRLKKGSKAYQSYYQKNPSYLEGDDAIREKDFLKNLKKPDLFKQRFFPIFSHNEQIMQQFYRTLDAIDVKEKPPIPKTFHQNIKATLKHYGALEVGIVRLKAHHYYTHQGYDYDFPKQSYGQKINTRYKTAIVFLMPMDLTYLKRSPHFETTLESMNVYLNAAYVGFRGASYLKSLGHRSMFQSLIYYITPLVPLAVDAGLGEVGMHNHLIHPKHGDKVRIGAVLTDLELEEDQPIDFGLEMFCKRCALCLINCPMQSISFKQRRVNGKRFYKFDDQSCYKIFKNAGTDCAVCIQSCPLAYDIGYERIINAKNDPAKIDAIIKEHLEKHGRRPSIKTPLPLVEEK